MGAQMFQAEMRRNDEDRRIMTLRHLHDKLDSIPFANGAAFDSRDNQHSICLENTRVGLLADIVAWAQCDTEKEIFWLKGVAGTGKSTITRTLATQLHAQEFSIGSFFFSRGEGDRGNGDLLVMSVAKQLARQNPDAFESLCSAYEQGITDKSLSFQWEELIYKPLSQVKERIGRLVLIIDALDDCMESDITEIIKIFTRGERQLFRVFITSRPETIIRSNFGQTDKTIFCDLALDQIPDALVKHDIRIYIEHHMREITDSRGLGGQWPSDNQISELMRRADRLFIYAATVCRYLKGAFNPKGSLERILDINVPDSSEKGLDKVYSQILENYLSCGNEEELEEQIDLFQRIVGTILILFEPLSIHPLAALLGISEDQVDSTLRPLYSVLDLPNDSESPIKIFHQSFRDFLIHPSGCHIAHTRLRSPTQFWMDEQAKHVVLLSKCLQTMTGQQNALRQNICDISSDGMPRTDIDDKTIQVHIPTQLQYSCRYWAHHLEQTKRPLVDNDEIHMFLKAHLLHWLEVMSILELISECIRSITRLLPAVNDKESRISELLHDTQRFLLGNCEIASSAPLQVYASSLIFAPMFSAVRRIFRHKIPQYIEQLPGVEENWSASLQILEGHTGKVNSVAFSPDGNRLSSASDDGTVILWDMTTGTPLQTIQNYEVKGDDEGFGAGNMRANRGFLTGGVIKLRDAVTGELLHEIEGDNYAVRSVAFSPDSRRLMSGGFDKTINLWDIITVSFSPDNGQDEESRVRPASCSSDSTIKTWDAATKTPLKTFTDHNGRVSSVSFSPDCRQLVSAGWDNTIRLWDAGTGELLKTLSGHNMVRSVAFSPDGRLLASGALDCIVMLWDLRTGLPLKTFRGHNGGIYSVAFSPDGKQLASGSMDHAIRVWDIAKVSSAKTRDGHTNYVTHLAIAPDMRKVVSVAYYDTEIRIWDTTTGNLLTVLQSHRYGIRSVSFSLDSHWLALCTLDNAVEVWDMTQNSLAKEMGNDDSGPVDAIAFSHNSQWLASASKDRTIKLWDTATYTPQKQFKSGQTDTITCIAFSHDGQQLATGSADKTIILWDINTHEQIQEIQCDEGCPSSISLGPDGKLLASSMYGDTSIWDATTGAPLQTCSVHDSYTPLKLSTDGAFLESSHGILSIIPTGDRGESDQAPRQIAVKDKWVVYGQERLVWLPLDYRPCQWVVHGGLLCLGTRSGRVVVMRFAL
ncbi:WD40 repeat-like protein [Aspergillus ellipticus CBS 707.79]|uniref:WD40 repeat-like protein n=1 Tax=Aspergillus ellipticus CBS 707.79 TaxID=1448320 RepID=A0A319CYI2_9EURO|nr:WD40 repeat-like protein [Aspergillus ellipticus CBS 707.79]